MRETRGSGPFVSSRASALNCSLSWRSANLARYDPYRVIRVMEFYIGTLLYKNLCVGWRVICAPMKCSWKVVEIRLLKQHFFLVQCFQRRKSTRYKVSPCSVSKFALQVLNIISRRLACEYSRLYLVPRPPYFNKD